MLYYEKRMLFSSQENQIKKQNVLGENNRSLVKELKTKGIKDHNVLSAIELVPRRIFVENHFIKEAYKNIPLPADCGQTISQPYVVAYMIACLNLKSAYKVLEIGTGTGYQTAILSYLCNHVFTIERFRKLFNKAKKNIEKLKIKNVSFKLGNGFKGWQNKFLFDSIIISAASEIIPNELLKSLKNKGCLIVPKKYPSGKQKLLLIKKDYENYNEEVLFDVKFVPLLNKRIE